MRSIGVFLALAGATSYLFPLFGRRSMIMGVFGPYEKYAAGAAIAIGLVLFLLSFRKKKEGDGAKPAA